ncbi:MAG: formylglycine-generating enzyme family protein, partial [Planctomycetes bacterium]|nr:formylglycine-generating enzyme family protein [Planctomycetota bacterium]
LPVENVSWEDCQAFCAKTGLKLPTEAQWEYACRAGTETPFSFGATISPEKVNYNGKYPYSGGAKGLDRGRTLKVGSLPANGFGLHEMHGNVWEWCQDAYDSGFYGKPAAVELNPLCTAGSGSRVLRGGGFGAFARGCRSADRFRGAPSRRYSSLGFRPAYWPLATSTDPSASSEAAEAVPAAEARRLSATSKTPRAIPGFAYLAPNAQGLPEYRHEQTGVVFVLLPGGTFTMGSPASEPGRDPEETQHEVTLASFLIAKHELTQEAWEKAMGAGENPSQPKGAKLPVGNVSWEDCQAFCAKTGLKLPTEAQWEYACRAGTETPFSFGTTITPEQVNYDGRFPYSGGSKGLVRGRTVEVASLPANGFGLHEMHGNVWEWCEDVYDGGFYGKPAAVELNPLCTAGSGVRVVRGGGFWSFAWWCRSAFRYRYAPSWRLSFLGFRPAYWLAAE